MTAPSIEPVNPPADPAKPADPAPNTPAPAAPADDKPLGPAGEKALAEERKARQAAEKQLAEQAKKFEPLLKFAEALGGDKPADGKSDMDKLTERLTQHESELAKERQARWRAEIAHEKGLTPKQAERLLGSTREELAADADELLSAFPVTPAGPTTPKPDPRQGARGTGVDDLAAQIADAQQRGDTRTVIRLKARQLAGIKPPTQ